MDCVPFGAVGSGAPGVPGVVIAGFTADGLGGAVDGEVADGAVEGGAADDDEDAGGWPAELPPEGAEPPLAADCA